MKSKQLTEQEQEYIKLDYTLKDPQERIALVNKIIESLPSEKLTKKYLDIMGEYILDPKTIDERKEKYPIISKNRQTVLSMRETSIEGLSVKYMNNNDLDNKIDDEDLLYKLAINDKNVILTPKYPKSLKKKLILFQS